MERCRYVGVDDILSSHAININVELQQHTSGKISRTGDREIIVEPSSALGRWPESVVHTEIPMNRSHEDLPKFSGQFDTDYLALKPLLEEIWIEAVQAVQARLELRILPSPDPPSKSPIGLITLWPYAEMEQFVNTEIEYVPLPLT